MHALKPPKLRPGDALALVSPAWGGAGLFPHRVELGRRQVERLGYRLRIGENALLRQGWVSASPAQRAADIHTAFRDPEVRAVVAAIGGDHANQLLPLLDFDLLRASPTIFMGYSDITVLNMAMWVMTGLVTFNGPAFITDFAEYPVMLPYTQRAMQQVLCHARPAGRIPPAEQWTEELLDWGQKLDLQRPRRMQPASGRVCVRPGAAQGHLLGGCLESLDHLRGTPYWPDEEQWRGALLFIETSEECPPPARVDSILMDYENMGVFPLINGLLVGRPMGYTPEQKSELYAVLRERTERYGFPVLAEMDFGHTAPQCTLPLGCMAAFDAAEGTFELLEAAVEDV